MTLSRLVRRPPRPLLLLGLLALAVGLVVWRRGVPATRKLDVSTPRRPNVFILSIDMLRADHMSLYGYPRATTPQLDRVARAGVWFTNTRAQSSWTFPSVVSLLTGLYPTSHGAGYSQVRDQYVTTVLSPRIETLATILHRHGYDTAAFITNPLLKRTSGLDRGFEVYRDDFVGELLRAGTNKWAEGAMAAEHVNQAVLDWLAEDRPGPRFAYVHYIDVHGPYLHPKAFGRPVGSVEPWEAERARVAGRSHELLVDVYDGELQHLDALIGQLLADIDARGFLRDAIVIVTSDHGEEFGDHGGHGHGHTLYEELLHVPLILAHTEAFPFQARIDAPTAQIDVLPTLLDFLGIAPPLALPGRSVRSLLEGDTDSEPRMLLSEIDNRGRPAWNLKPGAPVVSYALLASSGSKYIAGAQAPLDPASALFDGQITREELYDLRSDPTESHPITLALGSAEGFRRSLHDVLAAAKVREAPPGTVPIDRETQRRLRALGYLPTEQGATPAQVPAVATP